MNDLLNRDDHLTDILHKVVSYHPEQRITIERHKSGVIIAYHTTFDDDNQIISKVAIPLTDDLRSLAWDFGYQIVYNADGTHGYTWRDFRKKPEHLRLLSVIATGRTVRDDDELLDDETDVRESIDE